MNSLMSLSEARDVLAGLVDGDVQEAMRTGATVIEDVMHADVAKYGLASGLADEPAASPARLSGSPWQGQIGAHEQTALAHVDKADEWANRDRVDPEYRPTIVDYHLRLASIHATLAIAQRLDAILGHWETRE